MDAAGDRGVGIQEGWIGRNGQCLAHIKEHTQIKTQTHIHIWECTTDINAHTHTDINTHTQMPNGLIKTPSPMKWFQCSVPESL